MILFLHHRYRAAGGEEQAVEGLRAVVEEQFGEPTEMLTRASGGLGRARAASGMVAGGLLPEEVARAVRHTGARIVHAHNLHPTLGWRALAAARAAGAAVVLHQHQYRMVCAIGVCFRDGSECTRCHGRNTLPGIRLNCRGSVPEALAYGAGLALWQRRLAAQADAFVVPSRFAESRLRALGAPLGDTFVVPNVVRTLTAPCGPRGDGPALLAGRLVPEKGVAVAVEACRIAGLPLLVAGDGPERARLELAGPDPGVVRFVGHVGAAELARLRAQASIALLPSLSAETFGLAAAEAMAAGLPVAASRVGALPELVPGEWLAPAGDPVALAEVIRRVRGEPGAGRRALDRARELTSPQAVAPALRAAYDAAIRRRAVTGPPRPAPR